MRLLLETKTFEGISKFLSGFSIFTMKFLLVMMFIKEEPDKMLSKCS